MAILNTILPIFLVIFMGWLFHQKGFLPQEFLGPGNRLVFYMAIPAMIFQAVAKANLLPSSTFGLSSQHWSPC